MGRYDVGTQLQHTVGDKQENTLKTLNCWTKFVLLLQRKGKLRHLI